MTCPFLRESQVKFCRTAAVRKLIPLTLAGKTDEKCSVRRVRHVRACTARIRKATAASGTLPVPPRIADAVLRGRAGRASSCRIASR